MRDRRSLRNLVSVPVGAGAGANGGRVCSNDPAGSSNGEGAACSRPIPAGAGPRPSGRRSGYRADGAGLVHRSVRTDGKGCGGLRGVLWPGWRVRSCSSRTVLPGAPRDHRGHRIPGVPGRGGLVERVGPWRRASRGCTVRQVERAEEGAATAARHRGGRASSGEVIGQAVTDGRDPVHIVRWGKVVLSSVVVSAAGAR